MKNSRQLKAKIKNVSKETGISAGLILQNYVLERLLERISLSRFKDNFILKGGYLIASIVGLSTRATMDMDVTLKGLHLNKQLLLDVFEEICAINNDHPFKFELINVKEIRKGDFYSGYKLSLLARYESMAVPVKLDITTGDKITPKEISFSYKMIFEEGYIEVLAYNLETILAEKIETIISRGDQNTRPRDYYDVYILCELMWDCIDFAVLSKAIKSTSSHRNTQPLMKNCMQTVKLISESDEMRRYWEKYQKDFVYASSISFNTVLNALSNVLKVIEWN